MTANEELGVLLSVLLVGHLSNVTSLIIPKRVRFGLRNYCDVSWVFFFSFFFGQSMTSMEKGALSDELSRGA